mmetsp:Transcript_10427/g.30611  ORF Transcript_10427/g.30611 Transcript_10427/m.30611 type:complete len:224 (-) Transcript_10427:170-841(-)
MARLQFRSAQSAPLQRLRASCRWRSRVSHTRRPCCCPACRSFPRPGRRRCGCPLPRAASSRGWCRGPVRRRSLASASTRGRRPVACPSAGARRCPQPSSAGGFGQLSDRSPIKPPVHRTTVRARLSAAAMHTPPPSPALCTAIRRELGPVDFDRRCPAARSAFRRRQCGAERLRLQAGQQRAPSPQLNLNSTRTQLLIRTVVFWRSLMEKRALASTQWHEPTP